MINLPNVTIICIDGVNPNIGIKALKYSMQSINFARNIILSHIKPDNISHNIEFIEIPKLTHETYSPFVLHRLHEFVETDFCLLINDDGFVINPHLWDNEFLKYDYIGAPWKAHYPWARVGNGGFSLRSKKFINLCRQLPCTGEHEDAVCCIFHRQFMLNNGCIFAPLEVAIKFSTESKIPENPNYSLENSFGFHGKGNPKDTSVHDGFYQQFQDKLKLLDSIQ